MWWLDYINPTIFIDGKNKTSERLNRLKNRKKFINVFANNVNVALERGEVENITSTMSQRIIKEASLWNAGYVIYRKAGQLWTLPGFPTGKITKMGHPTEAIVYGRDGSTEVIKLFIPQGDVAYGRETNMGTVVAEKGDGVFIRENSMLYPFINHVIDFSEQIADTYRTLEVTRQNIKKPYIIVAEEAIIESVKAFFNKRDNNEEYIISSGVFPTDKINLLPFELNPDNVRDCTGLIDYYEQKFWELCSISAAPATIDKKAQITTDELHQNAGISEMMRATVRNVMQHDLNFANVCFQQNFKYKSNTEQEVSLPTDREEEKGEENVSGSKRDENA